MKYAAATRRGQIHQLNGQPLQDRAGGARIGQVCAVVLCDGAGSCPGSEQAAEALVAWGGQYLCREFENYYVAQPTLSVIRMHTAAMQALAEAGVSEEQASTTFLALASHEDGRWLTFHIGDGRIFIRTARGVELLSDSENGRYANETFFLNEPLENNHLRVRTGWSDGPFAALLTSDGCASLLYDEELHCPAPAVEMICDWLRLNTEQEVAEALEHHLAETFAPLSDDDLSLAVLWNPGRESELLDWEEEWLEEGNDPLLFTSDKQSSTTPDTADLVLLGPMNAACASLPDQVSEKPAPLSESDGGSTPELPLSDFPHPDSYTTAEAPASQYGFADDTDTQEAMCNPQSSVQRQNSKTFEVRLPLNRQTESS